MTTPDDNTLDVPPRNRNQLQSRLNSVRERNAVSRENRDTIETRSGMRLSPEVVRGYQLSLKRNLRVLAVFQLILAGTVVCHLAMSLLTPGLVDQGWGVAGVVSGLLMVAAACLIRRGRVWPVIPVVVVNIPLFVVLSIWLNPLVGSVICGVPLVTGVRAGLLGYRLIDAQQPMFDVTDLNGKQEQTPAPSLPDGVFQD